MRRWHIFHLKGSSPGPVGKFGHTLEIVRCHPGSKWNVCMPCYSHSCSKTPSSYFYQFLQATSWEPTTLSFFFARSPLSQPLPPFFFLPLLFLLHVTHRILQKSPSCSYCCQLFAHDMGLSQIWHDTLWASWGACLRNVQAFVRIFSCICSAHQCNILQTQLSLHYLRRMFVCL